MFCLLIGVESFKIKVPLFLSSNYWCYDFDARVFIIYFYFWIFFVIKVPFGILTHYPNIDSRIGNETTFNGSYKSYSR